MTGAELGDQTVDVLVIGSGAGGLAAAIAAAAPSSSETASATRPCRVLVVEKEPVFGGTTAWSGGWMWIPGNPLAASGEQQQAAVQAALVYLIRQMGFTAFKKQLPKILAYLNNGPAMLDFFRSLPSHPLEFDLQTQTPDFHDAFSERKHLHQRAVRARAVYVSRLDPISWQTRAPLDLLTLFGMGIEDGDDILTLMRSMRKPLSWRALVHTTRLLVRHFASMLPLGIHKRLVNGNALVARLSRAAQAFEHLSLHAGCKAIRLTTNSAGGVTGAVIESAGREVCITARRGVVLACGGCPHDAGRWQKLAPRPGLPFTSAAPPSNSGDGLKLGEAAGGGVPRTQGAPAVYAPVSLFRRKDGRTAVYPHFVERDKPGVIAVNRAGKRFCDEAKGYHDVIEDWAKATPLDRPMEAWLICDSVFLAHYGLGAVKPFPGCAKLKARWPLRSGYLVEAATIEALADRCGIDPRALRRTIDAYNGPAASGLDPQFGRGRSAYERSLGDPLFQSPTGADDRIDPPDDEDERIRLPYRYVAPIETPPFYAVRLQPGSLGTFAGLDTDTRGRVLHRTTQQPIPGLYACGNDMAAPMGGFYPASGLTLGAAMTFGWLIGTRLAATETRG